MFGGAGSARKKYTNGEYHAEIVDIRSTFGALCSAGLIDGESADCASQAIHACVQTHEMELTRCLLNLSASEHRQICA